MRRLAVGLTAVVVIAGIWGVYLWWNRPMPPPLGDIALESVTPPDTVLSLHPQAYCSESVPGFWATGRSGRSEAEVRAWFDDRFGPVREEATVRLNRQGDLNGRHRVYDDIEVFTRNESGGTFVWVQTYETTSHFCIRRSHDPWDLENAATFMDACDKLVIEFWGVQYGAGVVESPPADWPVMMFDAGQLIAHGIEDPSVIYAKTSADDDWVRYDRGEACFLD
jgi:hypothetical protein